MKSEPVTDEYAYNKVKEALLAGDMSEADKWKYILRMNAEMRIRAKLRMRDIKNRNLTAQLKEMYRLSP